MWGGAVVELKNVSFTYGSEDAEEAQEQCVRDVSLSVGRGEFVLLTGPSGCGKTTVLRLINGLIPQFYPGTLTGSVEIDGMAVSERELYDTAKLVGTVFQNPRSQFYNVDTTGELAFACENNGLPAPEIYRRIDETVAAMGIAPLMDRSIFHLSDGEKQKIACASVSAVGPEVILLDEPSANLDYPSTLALREVICRWKAEGKTILAAEHRIAYLWDLIDRAVILRDGEIVRELRGREKDEITVETLETLGLRSTVQEAPEDVPLPGFEEGDEAIVLRDFHFAYRGEKRQAVSIDFLRIAAGEITAIVGANGAGKTSLLNCLCGLEKRATGIMEYRGRAYDRKARRKLCFLVMQDTGNQLFTESVREEVLISLPKNTPEPEEAAKTLLCRLDLGEYLDRHPQSLSGGQKQRLAIACAIASGRKIMLLDEPTSGLDWAHMMETAQMLKELKAQGITVLVVTHDSELIRACCDRMITFS